MEKVRNNVTCDNKPSLKSFRTYLRQDSHTQCVLCPLYHVHTAAILAVLCVHVCTGEPSGLCGLLTAPQQP